MICSKLCCYQDHKYQYFGCVPVRIYIFIVVAMMTITQLYVSIFFLTFQDWYWFICFFIQIPALVLLVFAIRVKHRYGIIGFIAYQCAFCILLLGTIIFLFYRVCHPSISSKFGRKCKKDFPMTHQKTTNCEDHVRTTAGIQIPIMFIILLLNIHCTHVILSYLSFAKGDSSSRRQQSADTRNMAPVNSPTVITVSAGISPTPNTVPTNQAPAPKPEEPLNVPFRFTYDNISSANIQSETTPTPTNYTTNPYSPYDPQPVSVLPQIPVPLPTNYPAFPMYPETPDAALKPGLPAPAPHGILPPRPGPNPPPRPDHSTVSPIDRYDFPPIPPQEMGDKYDFPPNYDQQY